MPRFEFVSWYGLWIKKDLPAEITATLPTGIANVLARPEVKARLSTLGLRGWVKPPILPNYASKWPNTVTRSGAHQSPVGFNGAQQQFMTIY